MSARIVTLVLCLFTLAMVSVSGAQSSVKPAALLVFPLIDFDPVTGAETLVQIVNTSDEAVSARCFYENTSDDCRTAPPVGLCAPVSFLVNITARQPLTWRVSRGLTEFALATNGRVGPGGQTNLGSFVPPASYSAFRGVLRCVATGADAKPNERNVLIGLATIENLPPDEQSLFDLFSYNAIGIPAVAGTANGDDVLILGGSSAEYAGCPEVLWTENLFDGARLAVGGVASTVSTDLILASCAFSSTGENSLAAASITAVNEFEQQFTVSFSLERQAVVALSDVDELSTLTAAKAGTLSGALRIRAEDGLPGLVGLTVERHTEMDLPGRTRGDAIHLQMVGTHGGADRIELPRLPRCVCDCNGDGSVAVNELVMGVNIALGTTAVSQCLPADSSGDGTVTVNELVSAVNAALEGCDFGPPRPTRTPTMTSTITMTATVTPTPSHPTSPTSRRSHTPTRTLTPEPTPTMGGFRPEVTYLGLSNAMDIPLTPGPLESGRPVYEWPFGQGFSIVVEAAPDPIGCRPIIGTDEFSCPPPLGTHAYEEDPTVLPDLQIILSRAIGDGSEIVCDDDDVNAGGVPAAVPFGFVPDAETAAAINDLGCRVDNGSGEPLARLVTTAACTKSAESDYSFVVAASRAQYCLPIARAWAFPLGDTILKVRVRDSAGTLSAIHEIVVRIRGN